MEIKLLLAIDFIRSLQHRLLWTFEGHPETSGPLDRCPILAVLEAIFLQLFLMDIYRLYRTLAERE